MKVVIGLKVQQNNGDIGEIVEILDNYRILVRFQSIEKECSMYDFKHGLVSNVEKNRCYVGMRVKQKCGLIAELCEMTPNNRCIVTFENGFTKEVGRNSFKSGKLVPRDTQVNRASHNIGTEYKNDLGQIYKIIERKQTGTKSIVKVQFEDGSIICVNRIKLSKRPDRVYTDYIVCNNSGITKIKGMQIQYCYFDKQLKKYVYLLRDSEKLEMWHN